MTSEAATIAAYDLIEANLGPVDTVIANAGIAKDQGRATDNPIEDFNATITSTSKACF